ncbi:MAG: MarR family transcriptional regulator [Armatimonadetes bacterium]|nr:MarR family transcriptional regulator [Armatimonadota bacterium]
MAKSPLTKFHRNAWTALLLSRACLSKQINRRLEAQNYPTIDVFDVLAALNCAPGKKMRMSELATKVVFSPSGLTRVVDRLESQGYVKREVHPSDRRSYLASLTDKGDEFRQAIWPVYQEALIEYWASQISESQAQALAEILAPTIVCTQDDSTSTE